MLGKHLKIFVLELWSSNMFNLLSCALLTSKTKMKINVFFKFALLAFPTFIKISNQVETHWVSLIFSFFWYFSRLRHTQVIHKLFNTFWKPLFNNFICVCILYLVLWWTFLYNYSQIFQRLSFLKNVWKDKNSWIYKNAYFF